MDADGVDALESEVHEALDKGEPSVTLSMLEKLPNEIGESMTSVEEIRESVSFQDNDAEGGEKDSEPEELPAHDSSCLSLP